MTFIARMIFLDEDAYPVFVPQNEGMLRPIKVIAPKGSIFNPNYPRACFARFCQVQRAVDLVLRALAPVVPEQITAGNSAHLHFISYSGFNTETQEYWVYLEVDEGSYGGRPVAGRPRLGRLPDRQHAQQPDRGARVALPDADRALRAARRAVRRRPHAGRDRHGAGQPLPRRHDRHLRGRAARHRPAVGHLRRPRRRERLDDPQRRPGERGALALEGDGGAPVGGRHAPDHGAELGGLRRPAGARPGARARRTSSTASPRSSSRSATTASSSIPSRSRSTRRRRRGCGRSGSRYRSP